VKNPKAFGKTECLQRQTFCFLKHPQLTSNLGNQGGTAPPDQMATKTLCTVTCVVQQWKVRARNNRTHFTLDISWKHIWYRQKTSRRR